MLDRGAQISKRSRLRAMLRSVSVWLVGLAFAGLAAGGIVLLHVKANAEATPDANPPVTVSVRPVALVDGYRVADRFAGRLEPARQTKLAFERGGLVVAVLVEEGDRVEAGAVVARLDTSKLEAERLRLEAQRREVEARLGLARVTLERQRALTSKGWQSAQRYDAARFAVEEFAAASARLDAAIRAIDIDLRKSGLALPFGGTVAARFVDEGAVVNAGGAVVEVLETGRRQVRVGVSVEAAEGLTENATYPLMSGERTFEGRLISKRPDLQTSTRTVTVILEALGAESVPFGEVVELILGREIAARGLWLPISALSEGRKGIWTVLTVVERDGGQVVAREAVEVLHVEGRRVFVRGTLGHGARVVLRGTNRVIPGQRVAAAAAE